MWGGDFSFLHPSLNQCADHVRGQTFPWEQNYMELTTVGVTLAL